MCIGIIPLFIYAVVHIRMSLKIKWFNTMFAGTFDQLLISTEDGTFPLNQLATLVQKNPTLLIIDLATMPQVIEFLL